MTVDSHRVQGQLVSCTEDTDRNLSSVGNCKRAVRAPQGAFRMPLSAANVPNSFFSCMMELLARNLWCTEFLWGWCSPWSSSKSFSSMADEPVWSTASADMMVDGNVYWVEGERGVRSEEGRGENWKM